MNVSWSNASAPGVKSTTTSRSSRPAGSAWKPAPAPITGHGNSAANKTDPRSRWIVGVVARRHKNVAAVALANKNARIAWALIVRGGAYDKQFGMATA